MTLKDIGIDIGANIGSVTGGLVPDDVLNLKETYDCQELDYQINRLRIYEAEVSKTKVDWKIRKARNMRLAKESLFHSQNCEFKLERKSLSSSTDIMQDRFEDAEDRILSENGGIKDVYLVGGAVVLIVSLIVFLK